MGCFPVKKGIYPVITEKFCANGSSIKTLEMVLKAGVKIVQLREKEYAKARLLEMAKVFRELTKQYGTLLVINDHADIAIAVEADGVHLGQDDEPCAEVKKRAPHLIIGVSTHNSREAKKAESDGADYINIGPVFETKTKKTGYPPLGIEKLIIISNEVKVPFTVMGGIKKENIRSVVEAGAGVVAMVSEITMAADPGEKVRLLNNIILSAKVWF